MRIREILLTALTVIIFVIALFFVIKNKHTNEAGLSSEEAMLVQNGQTEVPGQEENMQKKEIILKENTDYHAIIKTSMGDIAIDLFEKEAPITVNNFVSLATDGFYDNLIFHRIIENFMIQGGDPSGNGTGGPGYSFQDEINSKKLVRGSLAMANAGPNTNGSQFFIVTAEATPWLDGLHTNFGQVTAGQEIVDAMSKVEKGANDKPVKDIVINSIEIVEK